MPELIFLGSSDNFCCLLVPVSCVTVVRCVADVVIPRCPMPPEVCRHSSNVSQYARGLSIHKPAPRIQICPKILRKCANQDFSWFHCCTTIQHVVQSRIDCSIGVSYLGDFFARHDSKWWWSSHAISLSSVEHSWPKLASSMTQAPRTLYFFLIVMMMQVDFCWWGSLHIVQMFITQYENIFDACKRRGCWMVSHLKLQSCFSPTVDMHFKSLVQNETICTQQQWQLPGMIWIL